MRTKFNSLLIILVLIAGVHSALAQLTNLGIAPAGNQTVLFWPTTLPNYVLQRTTNLASPNWVTVSNSVPVNAVAVTNVSPASFFRLVRNTTSDGMVLIPAGVFTIGDALDGDTNATPTNVTVSAFYMDTNLVSYGQWQSVLSWATNHGYSFDPDDFPGNIGEGKAANHPVQSLNWYNAIKWCNARSQQSGLTPVYYTDAGITQVYTNGDIDAVYANWTSSGYRLPTEAEWEKAARGGLSGQRFPWGNTINQNQANYFSSASYSYDLGPNGYNSIGIIGGSPYTSPVGSFAPNGYGLFDMAGNVAEWCWDWYAGSPYPTGSPYLSGTDPRGPASSPTSQRILRGGGWSGFALTTRCAYRIHLSTTFANGSVGFRCVKGN